ncbi:MAG: hypothetical protein ACI8RD_007983 [Bacillariaceae sp.]|jgi:hypothetical protein
MSMGIRVFLRAHTSYYFRLFPPDEDEDEAEDIRKIKTERKREAYAYKSGITK